MRDRSACQEEAEEPKTGFCLRTFLATKTDAKNQHVLEHMVVHEYFERYEQIYFVIENEHNSYGVVYNWDDCT